MKIQILAVAAAVSALAAASSAQAALYDFTFAAANVTGSGVFTTEDAANADGGYLITMTTGSLTQGSNTLGITGPNTYAGADNLLFADTTPYLDFDGTSFHLSNGLDVNIYYSGNYKYIRTGGSVNNLTSFTITPEAGAVPEPTTWAMMLGGFGIVGLGMRRRSDRAIQAI